MKERSKGRGAQKIKEMRGINGEECGARARTEERATVGTSHE